MFFIKISQKTFSVYERIYCSFSVAGEVISIYLATTYCANRRLNMFLFFYKQKPRYALIFFNFNLTFPSYLAQEIITIFSIRSKLFWSNITSKQGIIFLSSDLYRIAHIFRDTMAKQILILY